MDRVGVDTVVKQVLLHWVRSTEQCVMEHLQEDRRVAQLSSGLDEYVLGYLLLFIVRLGEAD